MQFINYILRVQSTQQLVIVALAQHYLEDCYTPIFALIYTLKR